MASINNDYTDADGRHYSALDVASRYFRSGADKISIDPKRVWVDGSKDVQRHHVIASSGK